MSTGTVFIKLTTTTNLWNLEELHRELNQLKLMLFFVFICQTVAFDSLDKIMPAIEARETTHISKFKLSI
jgi:hypothetical protein